MTLPNPDTIRPVLEELRADELAAATALRAATSINELTSVWWRDCDGFFGAPRERLQDTYSEMLAKFAPMSRAG